MKSTTTPVKSSNTNRLKALVLLAAVFALAAAVTFGGRRALGKTNDAQPTEAELQQARQDAIAAIPRLPQDTEDKLAAALYPQIAPMAAFTNPLDRAGLSANASTS